MCFIFDVTHKIHMKCHRSTAIMNIIIIIIMVNIFYMSLHIHANRTCWLPANDTRISSFMPNKLNFNDENKNRTTKIPSNSLESLQKQAGMRIAYILFTFARPFAGALSQATHTIILLLEITFECHPPTVILFTSPTSFTSFATAFLRTFIEIHIVRVRKYTLAIWYP